MVSIAVSNPISDLAFMDHIVRVVAAGMVARASYRSNAVGEGYVRDELCDLLWGEGCRGC